MGSSHFKAAQIGKQRLFALGRVAPGEMNKCEQRYEDEVLKPALHSGDVAWYKFEAIKLRLADRTFLTVDFAVLPRSGVMELHDVKGARMIYMEDAKVKMKVAAELFPFVFKVAFAPKRGMPWDVEEV